jgi:hypothetical protein
VLLEIYAFLEVRLLTISVILIMNVSVDAAKEYALNLFNAHSNVISIQIAKPDAVLSDTVVLKTYVNREKQKVTFVIQGMNVKLINVILVLILH